MGEAGSVVFVIDDDASVRAAITTLLRPAGLDVRCFASARDFLISTRPDAPACLVLDLQLPGARGLDLQQEMAVSDIRVPIVFISGASDVPAAVRAMKAGAVEFLTKPFRDQDLMDAIQSALARATDARREWKQTATLRTRFGQLSQRERQVFELVVAGRPNKLVASELGITEVTVKIHRGRIMHKMKADSLPDLVRMAGRLGLSASLHP